MGGGTLPGVGRGLKVCGDVCLNPPKSPVTSDLDPALNICEHIGMRTESIESLTKRIEKLEATIAVLVRMATKVNRERLK